MGEKIYILDEIVVKPGLSVVYRDAYFDRYAPGARERGMTLEAAWRTPPIDLKDRSATLYFLWSVPNVTAWWAMRVGAARTAEGKLNLDDSEKAAWWRESETMTVSRKRSMLEDFAKESL